MNKRHKAFIIGELIPFIMREQGRGFAMDKWIITGLGKHEDYVFDDRARRAPKCGTVCCIGGAIELLKHLPHSADSDAAGKAIGLNEDRSWKLFHGWINLWPKMYTDRYRRARTTCGKAKVARDLLREVVRTNGKCLDGDDA